MKFDWVDPRSLKPNNKNPNKHGQDQLDRLIKIIKAYGWRHPIIVSNRSGLVVVGHGRLEAALQMGVQSVPVHYQDFSSDDEEYGFLVADNAVADWSELDLAAVHSELENLSPDFDLELLGLKSFSLEPKPKKAQICKNCGHNTEQCG